MKCYIKLIAVLDNNENSHFVKLTPGLNIITGSSSTGKSALIEIFDYCFGSSDYTVPTGIITDNAAMYYVVLQFCDYILVLARRPESKHCFIKELTNVEEIESLTNIKSNFFDENFFYPLKDFKIRLNRHFDIDLTSVDEDLAKVEYLKKSATPSSRSFMSFCLQHQNLIANKHAIFYRFDQKEKREQAIEHFKIFMGIVDQDYFYKKQKISQLDELIKTKEKLLRREVNNEFGIKAKLKQILNDYHTLTGTDLLKTEIDEIYNKPEKALQLLKQNTIKIDLTNSDYEIRKKELDGAYSQCFAQKRELINKKNTIDSSINYIVDFTKNSSSINLIQDVGIQICQCPFCQSEINPMLSEAHKLTDAINWLNKELQATPYLAKSLSEEKNLIEKEIKNKNIEFKKIETNLKKLAEQTENLQNKTPISQLAEELKLRFKIMLEDMESKNKMDMQKEIENLKTERDKLEKAIDQEYKLKRTLNNLQNKINNMMNQIGENFDFEKSYCPINLHFKLESFDLYHKDKKRGETYLRSMGSGANWLYSHLSLFLSLHSLFATNKKCKIPPILFLDQPTQVYFPNFQDDDAENFNPENLVSKMKRDKIKDDLSSVKNIFKELITFCENHKDDNGDILIQIIVTDHVDNLGVLNNNNGAKNELSEKEQNLQNKIYNYNNYVRARWRKQNDGFIN
ncbi:MAG: DUF3732 domain-containing protein [Gilliamella sp.]|nr:DUF3732 domain-containing protein [Gilliamella sp.]